MAICIPACTGFKPVPDSCQDSTVCMSRLTAERNGRFNLRRNFVAASLSFIAGPPTKLKPVKETIWLTRDAHELSFGCAFGLWTLDFGLWTSLMKNFSHASRLSIKVEMAGRTCR